MMVIRHFLAFNEQVTSLFQLSFLFELRWPHDNVRKFTMCDNDLMLYVLQNTLTRYIISLVYSILLSKNVAVQPSESFSCSRKTVGFQSERKNQTINVSCVVRVLPLTGHQIVYKIYRSLTRCVCLLHNSVATTS